ncbi:MAG: metallophosphoesterase [Acetanaerobacterium sp.]
MALYVISDLHLSLGGNKPMDIFPGWDGYVERIRHNWEATISPADTVMIGGDISWALDLNGALCDFQFIEALPGKKVILKGNHDYFWSTISKMNTFFENNGINSIRILHNNCVCAEDVCLCGTRGWIFDGSEPTDQKVILREAGRLRLSLAEGAKTGLETLCFLHYPPLFAKERCEEILAVLHEYNVKRCYYGHIHGSGCGYAVQGMVDGIEYIMTSADYLRFKPLRIF